MTKKALLHLDPAAYTVIILDHERKDVTPTLYDRIKTNTMLSLKAFMLAFV